MTAARVAAWLIVAAGAVLMTAVGAAVIVGLRRGRVFGDDVHDVFEEEE